MQVSDELVNQMLRNLPQDQQQIVSGILTEEYTHEVICNSDDVYEDVDVPVTDDDGNVVLFKTGERKGQIKTKKERQLVREGAKGRVIAYITADNKVVPTKDEKGRMWLRSSRRRLDGEWGFQSWCGTDSLLAEQEKDVIGEHQPTKDDLYQIASRLNENAPKYATINGEREVDGFVIREVRK